MPGPIVVGITVPATMPALPSDPFGVAIAAMTPEDVGATIRGSVWSTAVPTAITGVMTVNEFRTLLVPVRVSTATSLGVCVG